MSQLALQRIRENIKAHKRGEDARSLDLGRCDMTEVPKEIGECMWLEELWLNGNEKLRSLSPLANLTNLNRLACPSTQVSDLSPLANLTKLNSLYCYLTQVSDLSPLANLTNLNALECRSTQVSDLSPLANLTNLNTLSCYSTQVSDLSPLANLTNLNSLYCSSTQVSDLSPLANLTNLNMLSCHSTQVSDLSPLANLTNLNTLFCNSTQVSDLSPLANLTNLNTLSCDSTQVSDLSPILSLIEKGVPVKWKTLYEHYEEDTSNWQERPAICVKDCPLNNPSVEVVQLGNPAILRYFDRIRHGAKEMYLREAKVVLVGEGGTGKTTLRCKLHNHAAKMPGKNARTRGIDVEPYPFEHNGHAYTAYLWDFGGQDIYYAVHRFFMSESAVYVLMAQSRTDTHNFEYWLPNIQLFAGPESPVLVFKNLMGGFKGDNMSLADYRGRFNIPEDLFELNLSEKSKPALLDAFKKKLHHHIAELPHLRKPIFEHELDVRDHLRTLREPHIAFGVFAAICRKFGVGLEKEEDISILARYLHNLGILLWYHERPFLKDIVILQPTWATGAVYKIIDDKRIADDNGHFEQKDLDRLWATQAYKGMHRELLELMKAFKLCYARKDGPGYIVPSRLTAEQPAIARDWASAGSVNLVYKYAFMPRGLVNQLTAELHEYIRSDDHAWNRGVVLHYDELDARARIKEDVFGQEITISASGAAAREFLVLIKREMENLHKDYPGIDPEIRIPCICQRCLAASKPEYYPYKKVLDWVRENPNKVVRCNEGEEDFPAQRLLQNIGEVVRKYPEGVFGGAEKGLFREKTRGILGREEMDLGGVPFGKIPFNPPPVIPKPSTSDQMIRIFIASSSELSEDRKQFRNFISEKNDHLQEGGKSKYLKLENWEAMSDVMSDRKQDDYNRRILESDVFVCLVHTKVGKYTEEEFDLAWKTFKKTNKPKGSGKPAIFTYFKKDKIDPDQIQESRKKFREKIEGLGHFPSPYEGYPDLERLFAKELDRILNA
ncbi:MAG: COR domain-containing protein [Saprospiraceae bacterium]